MNDLSRARVWLFTPASRPDRFIKALGCGADAIILDLEDAVAETEKATARANVLEFLRSAPADGAAIVVRINSLSRVVGLEDFAALSRAPRLDGVLIPKVENAEQMSLASAALDDVGSNAAIAALIESARGVAALAKISLSCRRLCTLMFGGADYAADLGQQVGGFSADHARAELVNAAAMGGLSPIDTPTFDLNDAPLLEAACRNGRALGFFGKAAIHPSQVAMLRNIFAPRADEVTQARRILEAAPNGVGVLDGRMIDAAMLRWARRVIESP